MITEIMVVCKRRRHQYTQTSVKNVPAAHSNLIPSIVFELCPLSGIETPDFEVELVRIRGRAPMLRVRVWWLAVLVIDWQAGAVVLGQDLAQNNYGMKKSRVLCDC